MKEYKLVVLESFCDETEANVAKGFLKANGITAYVFDNDPAHRFSFRIGTNLDFAIRLMVDSSDLKKAQELLGVTPPLKTTPLENRMSVKQEKTVCAQFVPNQKENSG